MSDFIFQQSRLPKLNSNWGKKLAKILWEMKLTYADERRPFEELVQDSDEAYMCHKYQPDTGAIELISDGEFGESDIHDNANVISIRLALTLMPRNERWITMTAKEDEAQSAVEALEDYQIFLHRQAKTRRTMQKFIKHNVVRGSAYLYFDWENRYRLRRLTDEENGPAIEKFLKDEGLPPGAARQFSRGRHEELEYSGPVAQCLDFYDVWVEPWSDIIGERQLANMVQRFRTISSLKGQKDPLTRKDYYQIPPELEPFQLTELYNNRDLAGGRAASARLFGRFPTPTTQSLKFVPVIIINMPYFEFEGYQFYDTQFHLAISSKGQRAHLLRIEENPNDLGINHLLADHYIDHYVNTPYGISGVQFQVHKLRKKDFLSDLTVTAAAHSVFPPYLRLEDAFRVDENQEINLGAGGFIDVMETPSGLDVMKPLQMPTQGAQLGFQSMRFLSDDMRTGMGTDGLATDSAARTMAARKTATEVNRDVTSGSFFLDNQAENTTDVLTAYVQGTFQLSQINAKPEEGKNTLYYERYLGQRAKEAHLKIQDLQAKRSVQVTSNVGQLNKEQQIGNLLRMLEVSAQIQDPRIIPYRFMLLLKLSKLTGVQVPEELEANPAQLAAMNPEVQQAVLAEFAAANPEIAAIVQQMMAPPPEAMGNEQQPDEAQRIDGNAPGPTQVGT